MKILVTGAAGFIGSNVAEKLVKRGDMVVGLDNFNDYYDPAKKRANQKRLSIHSNFRMIEADIRDRRHIFAILAKEKFDTIAHLAAMAGLRNAVAKPDLYIEVNLNGTQHLMDAALAAGGVRNFVCASTSSVYGNTKLIPFVETDPCNQPLQPYAAAKRAAELLGFSYHNLFGLNFTAVRFFTVYGPNGRPDMMAYLVAESITKGKELPLYDSGKEMYRDWTFVDDIADGVVAAIDRPFGYEIINLGRGQLTSLVEFVTFIEELAGKKAHIIHTPRPASDVQCTYADISKARQLLDYNPKVSVPEGVKYFWEWYKKTQI